MTNSTMYPMSMPSTPAIRRCLPSRGELPSGKTRLVQAWIEIHRDELLADWQLAVNGEEVFKIEPLE
jgi:hypothetical protein